MQGKLSVLVFFVLFLGALPGAAQTLVGIPDGPDAALPGDPLNQDKAIFNVSTFDYWRGRAYYFSAQNNRILVNFQRTDGSWEFHPSVVALDFPESATEPSITVALGVVLASATADFYDAWDGNHYQRLMYLIWQGSAPGEGQVCAAFSNDGVSWVRPAIRVGPPGTPLAICGTGGNLFRLESVSGSRTGNTLWLAGLEGNTELLKQYMGTGRTFTYLISADVNSPHVLRVQGELPAAGLSTPTAPGEPTTTTS